MRLLRACGSDFPLAISGERWLPREQKLLEKAEIFIREAFGDVHSRVLISWLWCYLAKADGFDQKIFYFFVGDMSPVVWWSLGRFGSRHEGLRSLAMKLLHHTSNLSSRRTQLVCVPFH